MFKVDFKNLIIEVRKKGCIYPQKDIHYYESESPIIELTDYSYVSYNQNSCYIAYFFDCQESFKKSLESLLSKAVFLQLTTIDFLEGNATYKNLNDALI